jgi:hypothetical protein
LCRGTYDFRYFEIRILASFLLSPKHSISMTNHNAKIALVIKSILLIICILTHYGRVLGQDLPPEPARETSEPPKRFAGVDVSGDTEICEGAETTLRVEGEYQSYQWSNGSTERSITVKKAGIYEVTVTTKGGCSFTTGVNVRTKPCIR